MKPREFTTIALSATRAGGEVLQKYFSKNIRVDFKGKIDPVTDADRRSQETIFKILKKHFPDHGMLGEEGAPMACDKEFCWIVDPLDGTVNFIHHIPLVCVSIGLMHKGKIISGVVHAPLMNETFVAWEGGGAWLNGKRIRVSKTRRLLHTLAVTGFPYYVHQRPEQAVRNLVNVIRSVQGIRRLGSAAIDLAYVAMGRCDVFWEEGLSAWDVAAGSLLVSEAGGKITDFNGGNDYIFGRTLLATNGVLHPPLRKIIRQNEHGARTRSKR